jgi:hypothetical protein
LGALPLKPCSQPLFALVILEMGVLFFAQVSLGPGPCFPILAPSPHPSRRIAGGHRHAPFFVVVVEWGSSGHVPGLVWNRARPDHSLSPSWITGVATTPGLKAAFASAGKVTRGWPKWLCGLLPGKTTPASRRKS